MTLPRCDGPSTLIPTIPTEAQSKRVSPQISTEVKALFPALKDLPTRQTPSCCKRELLSQENQTLKRKSKGSPDLPDFFCWYTKQGCGVGS